MKKFCYSLLLQFLIGGFVGQTTEAQDVFIRRKVPVYIYPEESSPVRPADARSRAKVIDEMVRIQIDLLKEKTEDPHPPMRLTLYNEMSNLVANGLFKLPNEPSLIRNTPAG